MKTDSSISKKASSGNRCLTFSPIDMFGGSPEFNINGAPTYKTFFGCFWSICMIALMLTAYIYYLLYYLDKTNVTMTSQFLQSEEYPKMDMKAKGLFFSLIFSKGEQSLSEAEVQKSFKISANLYELTTPSSSDGNSKTTVTKIVFKPCKSAGITGKVQGKTIKGKTSIALSDYGYCPDIFDNSNRFLMQGDDDSDYYAYIEIKIFPCDGTFPKISAQTGGGGAAGPSGPLGKIVVTETEGKQCYFPNQKGGTYNIRPEEYQYLRQSLRPYTVSVTTIDAAVEATNYADPLVFMLNSENKISISSTQEKSLNFFFSTISINTDRGALLESYKVDEAYSIDNIIFDIRDRDPNDRVKFVSPEGETYQPIPYLTLKFLSGNSRQEYTRKYIKIVEVLGLVGGITEIFTSVILVLYGWYNGIRMEQEIINLTILHLDPDDDTLEDWELKRKLGFREVLAYHYIPCCYKKTDRYQLYKKLGDKSSQLTDITKIMDSVLVTEVFKRAIMSTAHERILAFMLVFDENGNNQSESSPFIESQALTASQAVDMLIKMDRNMGFDEREKQINNYLLTRLPKQLRRNILADRGTGSISAGIPSQLQTENHPLDVYFPKNQEKLPGSNEHSIQNEDLIFDEPEINLGMSKQQRPRGGKSLFSSFVKL